MINISFPEIISSFFMENNKYKLALSSLPFISDENNQ